MAFSDRSKRSAKRIQRGICWVLVAAPLFCFAPSSHAAGPEDASTTDVEKLALDLYRQGNAAFKRGDFQEAREQYQSAWDLKPGYDIAGSLASAEIKLRDYRSAAEHLVYALRTFPLSGDPALRVKLDAMFAEARAEVASVKIEVTPADAKITVDGAPIAATSGEAEVFVEAGARVVGASREGYVSASQEVLATKGGTHQVEVTLVPVAVETPPEETGPRTGLIGAGIGLTGAAAITGVVMVVVANGKSGDRSSAIEALGGSSPCGAGTSNASACAGIQRLSEDERTFGALAAGAFGVAGLALIGTVVYASWPRKPSASSASVVLSPVAGPNEAGLELVGHF